MRNRVYLIGKVSKNINVNSYKSGVKRAFFTLMIDESHENSDGKKVNKTTPVNVVAWDNMAEIIEKNVKAGQEIAVEARINRNTYKNSEGINIYDNQITVTEIYFLTGNNQEKREASS